MEANNYTLQNHNSNLIRREEFGKPVIFIDSKPVKDAETVISECEALISLIHQNGTSSSQYVLSSSQSNNNSFQMFHPQTKAIKNRTHSAYAISMYDKLQPKIFDAEKILRGLLLVIIDKKAVLRTQAKQIVTRLIACIDYQTNLLIKSDTPIQELRDVVNDLANESASVKTMVAFNFELLRLHTAQSARQGKTVLSWARKKNANQGPSDEDLAKDYEHRELHHRLHQLRSVCIPSVYFSNCYEYYDFYIMTTINKQTFSHLSIIKLHIAS